MFKTKFSNTDAGFNPNFKQSNTSVDTNFDGYEILKGEDGFSPIVEIEKNDTGHRISITDTTGKKVFDILDGQDGKDGYTPVKGIDYFDGEIGPAGPAGPAGRDGEKGKDGAPGIDGKDGYTPIKGTDYFTEKEVQEIVQRAAEMVDIPEGGVTSWNDLKDKPSFANVALTGDYNDLSNTPVLPERISDLDDDLGIATTEYIELVKKQIPTLISQLENDLKYVDEEDLQAVKDSIPDTSNLADKEYVDDMVSKIPKFETIVVEALPAENISATAVYLLKADKFANNLYEEYIYINNQWELLGSAKINLESYAKTEDIPTKVSQLENDSQFMSEEQVNTLFQRLNSNTALKFYCIEDVTVIVNGISTTYPANSNIEIKLLDTDVFEIIPTSENSILSLSAFPGALGVYYPWLEGVKQFSNILFDMNDVDMYSKWSQGNQGSYGVQFAQYLNCVFWSDNPYISDVAKRTNYTLFYSSQIPLCYSSIPDNTFKAFYLAFNVNSDPNWGNKAYRDSFAKATWATQVFSYYGARTVGIFGHDDPDFNIVLPKDCRGLFCEATAVENAGTFDAINVTNFGAKQGSWRDAFRLCVSLRQLYIKNLKVNLNISWSPIDHDSISFIIASAANTKKITISVSPYTYNLLRPADFELAASKNIVIELLTTNYVEDKRLSAIITNGDGSKVLSNDGTYKTLPTKTSQLENDSNFLTEHQSLENYVTKDELPESPDLTGLATEEFVKTFTTAAIEEEREHWDSLITWGEW